MASARKKQDEKHLKILRELVSLPSNKECFDCHQRGPTYVNMTIGSFVCTSCSGLVRGLTPPHRVKSISMATFSPEEIELVKSRGNEYCRQIWLGLFDVNNVSDTKDEQQIKEFMIAKYERKRYYLEPSAAMKNGPVGFTPSPTHTQSRTSTPTPTAISAIPEAKPLSILLGSTVKPLVFNMPPQWQQWKELQQILSDNMFTPDKSSPAFLEDFNAGDPFSSSMQFTANISQQPSFANFDNNPAFTSSMAKKQNMYTCGPVQGQVNVVLLEEYPSLSSLSTPTCAAEFHVKTHQQYRKQNNLLAGMPTAATLSNMSPFSSPARKAASSVGLQPLLGRTIQLPAEDRYAALKDLDSQMKSQQTPEPQLGDWSTVPTSGSAWPISNGVVYGSGSQGNLPETAPHQTANPFTGGNSNPWTPVPTVMSTSTSVSSTFGANPFRTARATFGTLSEGAVVWGAPGVNGMPNGQVVNGVLPAFHQSVSANNAFTTSQSMNFATKPWQGKPQGNPFALGMGPTSAGHSSNPFL
uniref:Arf-GAP domain-containing protein n=1 Tax=Timema cristinae TaxID=61476 RepID=A0A7R9CAQ3_TIMCR|nr:unnamed protein product [Timema cristinae]